MEPIEKEANLLRIATVAQVLSLSPAAVYNLAASGELPVVRFGRAVRVPRKALADWIAARTEGGQQ